MAIPTEKAYEILNLPLGASKDAIEQSYKKLAVKWHPEKFTTQKNTQEALKKFKSINIAYRKLIHNDRSDKDITLHEMFEQFRNVFHSENNKKNKLIAGQTIADIKNATDNANHQHQNTINNNKTTTLSELNNNNNFVNNKNYNGFGNELNTNFNHNTTKINNSNTSNNKSKLINDKNNNNDEENYENQYQSLRKDDQLDQNLLSIKLKIKTLAIKGNELAKQSEYVKAIEKFTEAIKYDSKDPRLFSNRSYCYDKLNCFQEALIDAEQTIILEPLWPKGYFRKGRALFGLKMYKEAEEAYEKVLEIDNIDDPELEEELFKTRVLQLQEMGFSKAISESSIKEHGTVQAALDSILVYSETDKSNESCSDMDNNELDYNENDSENGDENKKVKLTSMKLKTANGGKPVNGGEGHSPYSGANSDSNSEKSVNLNGFYSNGTSSSNASQNHHNFSQIVSNGISSSSNNSNNHQHHNHYHNHNHDANNVHHQASNSNNGNSHHSINNNHSSQIVAPSTSLWIGNVDPNVTEDMLQKIFAPFGQLANVRCLPEKYCAFVNYKLKDDASKAMQNLQGKNLEGQKLLIKYPDNPNTALLGTLVAKCQNKSNQNDKKPAVTIQAESNALKAKKKLEESKSAAAAAAAAAAADASSVKLTGPVNGNECYFWRTTGCLYADKCRYEHIKKNKGIDKKPWHKS